MPVKIEMQDARHRARAAAAPQGDVPRPATKDDVTTGVSKDELRAFAAEVKLALTVCAVVIVVATVGFLRLLP